MTQEIAKVVVEHPTSRAIGDDMLEAIDVVAQHRRIEEAMSTVMIRGHHFGMVYKENGDPAFQKPMLLKAGAEMLCKLFHFRPHYEEMGAVHTPDLIGYRIRCVLTHFPTGVEIAEGMGSCNSRERKYRREDAWNIDNTLLKMACKRALMSAVLVGTAASDIFTTTSDKTTTDWHKLINARAAELDQSHPREDGKAWADWTRDVARERWDVQSRSELDAEQLEDLAAALDAEVIPFG